MVSVIQLCWVSRFLYCRTYMREILWYTLVYCQAPREECSMPFLQEFPRETALLRLFFREQWSMVHTLTNAFQLYSAFPSLVVYKHVNFLSVVRFHSLWPYPFWIFDNSNKGICILSLNVWDGLAFILLISPFKNAEVIYYILTSIVLMGYKCFGVHRAIKSIFVSQRLVNKVIGKIWKNLNEVYEVLKFGGQKSVRWAIACQALLQAKH